MPYLTDDEHKELQKAIADGETHANEVNGPLEHMAKLLGVPDEVNDADLLRYANGKLADLYETYTDRHGTVWSRPTAWAWFAAYRANNYRSEQLSKAEGRIKRFMDFTDRMGLLPDNVPMTQGSQLAKQQLTAGDLKSVRLVLQALTQRVPTDEDDAWDEAVRQAAIAMKEDPVLPEHEVQACAHDGTAIGDYCTTCGEWTDARTQG